MKTKIFTITLAFVATASVVFAQSPITAEGAINALFSTSDTTQVLFSRGNLQFNAAQGTHACADGTTQAGTWRFATEQFDVRLNENINRGENYDGWIDLFSYGASGYNDMAPYNSNVDLGKETMLQLGKIAGTNYDFGTYNAIENGGNSPGIWHMFTLKEWSYLVNSRTNASSLRGHATINNIHGIVLLPDNCDLAALHQIASFATSDNAMNNYSLSVWQQIETLGAVFLPADGRYASANIINPNDGNYMASFSPYMNSIDGVYFTDNTISTATFPQAALSVRLVQNVISSSCILAKGTCGAQGDNLTWELSCEGGLTIKGTGAMSDYLDWNSPWREYKDSIKSVIVEEGVTSIGYAAFRDHGHLQHCSLPSTIESIGEEAFCFCFQLMSIEIPDACTWIGTASFNLVPNVVITDESILPYRD